jgi:hypothetical protein
MGRLKFKTSQSTKLARFHFKKQSGCGGSSVIPAMQEEEDRGSWSKADTGKGE